MIDNRPQPETTPFWRFSLHFYRRPGVSDAFIALQDACGVDVNLLLFLFWLACGGQLLAADDVRRLDDRVRTWRDLTIIPIRNLRRKLKGAPTAVDPAQQEAFRTKVKEIELAAERLQQAALYGVTQGEPLGAQSSPSAAARANVAAYEHTLNLSFPTKIVDLLISAFDGIDHRGFARAATGQ
jgi:uncharacterized protein (TIGR02444 family)